VSLIADLMLDRGDDEGRQAWPQIRRAIEALQAAPRNKLHWGCLRSPPPEKPGAVGNQGARSGPPASLAVGPSPPIRFRPGVALPAPNLSFAILVGIG
jgi:hypothetical protein